MGSTGVSANCTLCMNLYYVITSSLWRDFIRVFEHCDAFIVMVGDCIVHGNGWLIVQHRTESVQAILLPQPIFWSESIDSNSSAFCEVC